MNDSPSTHRTRLQSYVKSEVFQAIIVDNRSSRSQGFHFSVRSRVMLFNNLIITACHYLVTLTPLSRHDLGTISARSRQALHPTLSAAYLTLFAALLGGRRRSSGTPRARCCGAAALQLPPPLPVSHAPPALLPPPRLIPA